MTRTGAFLHYAEEHPGEVLDVTEDKTEALIRELEQQHRETLRAPRSVMRRAGPVPRQSEAAPF
jgi:CBS-domain-containing membrane protein